MRRSPATRPPVVSPLVLGELDPVGADDLAAQQVHDRISLRDADLTGHDLTGATVTEGELVGITADRTVLRHARLIETRIERLSTPVLVATRSTWRDVELIGSRLGAVEADDAELRTVRVVGGKIDWLTLRSSTLEDVLIQDCTLEELDLTGATAARVAFENCRVGTLTLAGARLTDVDLRGLEIGTLSNLEALRGATLDAQQVTALAPALAAHLGIRVEA